MLATDIRSCLAADAHKAAAEACEKAIDAILTNRHTRTPENGWAEVVALDVAWNATESAWLRSREAGSQLELAQYALNCIEAAMMEETGSDRAIAWLRIATGAHRAASAVYRAEV